MSSFPKLIWLYWSGTIPKSVNFCVELMKKIVEPIGWKVHMVQDDNLNFFLEDCYETMKPILNLLHPTLPQKGDIVRLCLLLKHGGVYFDASTIFIPNFTDKLLNFISNFFEQKFSLHFMACAITDENSTKSIINYNSKLYPSPIQYQYVPKSFVFVEVAFMCARKQSSYIEAWLAECIRCVTKFSNYNEYKKSLLNDFNFVPFECPWQSGVDREFVVPVLPGKFYDWIEEYLKFPNICAQKVQNVDGLYKMLSDPEQVCLISDKLLWGFDRIWHHKMLAQNTSHSTLTWEEYKLPVSTEVTETFMRVLNKVDLNEPSNQKLFAQFLDMMISNKFIGFPDAEQGALIKLFHLSRRSFDGYSEWLHNFSTQTILDFIFSSTPAHTPQ